MTSEEEQQAEECVKKYPEYADVPWESCMFCIARMDCGKPKPEESEIGFDV